MHADYTVVDRSPVCLKAGEIVDLGMEDKANSFQRDLAAHVSASAC